jgi:hypothetical protein
MTDYVFRNGTSGLLRHAASRDCPWIGHPRDRAVSFPQQPRFALSGEPWAADRAKFEELASASNFERACDFVRNSGFKIATTDVPEPVRDAFIAWAGQNLGPIQRTVAASEILMGPGWS